MKTGFIGLGVQGKYLAINQARAGYDLMAYDVRKEPLEDLAAAGAKIATSSREVGQHSEVVQVCVLDDAQVERVMFGSDGVLAGAAAGTIVVIHSTVRPSTIAKVADAAVKQGIEVIDAAVSGSEGGARAKTMSYMVGSSEAAFAKCRPLFETSGTKIVRTGGPGTGIRAKIAHQLIICVNLLAAHEGMLLGVKAGLDAQTLEAVVRDGMAQSRVAEAWSRIRTLMGPHARAVFYKDLQVCLEYGHELGLSLPGAALTQQLLDELVP